MNNYLKWKCRRGMKELDILFEKYLQTSYPISSESSQKAFQQLLDYQDPMIIDLLFSRIDDSNPEIQKLVNILKTYQLNNIHS